LDPPDGAVNPRRFYLKDENLQHDSVTVGTT